jgi:hypothetical protein
MTAENLRREARVEAKVPIVLRRGAKVLDLWTSDVSFKGLFVRTASPPAIRSLIRMQVTLPSGTIDTHAMVVHVVDGDSGGVGLQFWGLSGADRMAWDSFVRFLIQEQRKTLKKSRKSGPHPAALPTPSGVRVVATVEKERDVHSKKPASK